MKDLENVRIRLNQVNDGLMYALETALINEQEGEYSSIKRTHDLFYIVWESLTQIEKDLDELSGHIKVCNAVYAVNHVNELKSELACLRGEAV